ncbi:hypothetical protein ACN27F_23285 [Solwaraspora sp. WMMB335]|uniref:hypothetical protein n=1 Tax=Solwaraspora sp. WMMB335 TaxID=3404118 RepID=UPI003B933EBD
MRSTISKLTGRVGQGARLRVGLLIVALLGMGATTAFASSQVVGTATDVAAVPRLSRTGAQLSLDDEPTSVVGYNLPGLVGCGSAPDPDTLDVALRDLRPGAVVRTRVPIGAELSHVKQVVAAADRHDLLVTLVLTADLAPCSAEAGPPTGSPRPHSVEWFTATFDELFLPWVRTIVPQFTDSAALAMWEVNVLPESTVGSAELGRFYDTVSGQIRTLDAKHLIAIGGLEPLVVSDDPDWPSLLDSPGIDVVTVRDVSAGYEVSSPVDDAMRAAGSVGLPVLVEVGVAAGPAGSESSGRADDDADTPCTGLDERAKIVAGKIDTAFRAGFAGVVAWSPALTPPTGTSCTLLASGDDDPLVGLLRDYRPPADGGTEPPAAVDDQPGTPAASPTVSSTPASSTGADPAPSVDRSTKGPTRSSKPGVPGGLRVVSVGDGQVRICWSAVAGADGYVIYSRNVVVGEDWFRNPYPVLDTCYVVRQMINGQAYELRVRAGNAAGEGGYSAVVRATAQAS